MHFKLSKSFEIIKTKTDFPNLTWLVNQKTLTHVMKYQKCIHYILSTYELWHINEHFENPLGSSVTVCVKTFLM